MSYFIDLRKLDNDELFELRAAIVRLKEEGYSGKEIERLTHVRSNRISEIWHKYLDGGMDTLLPNTPGRKMGEQTLLSEHAEQEIKQIMIENTPDMLRMSYSLWTNQIASDLIRRKYNIKVHIRSMTNYLKKWGFTTTSPMRDEELLQNIKFRRFMEYEFPIIVRRAKSENIGIYWYCESKVNEKITITAAMTARGTARFMFVKGKMSQQKFLNLMNQLIRYADRKVFFIVSNQEVFKGKNVEAWLKSHYDIIEVFYHPAEKYNIFNNL